MIRVFVVVLFIFALARTTIWYTGTGSEFDFVLAIDSSNSMLVQDFPPNRLESAKQSAIDFVDSISPSSKIGVVTFAGTPEVKTTLTNEFSEVRSSIRNIEVSSGGGTDLSGAIITGTNLLDLSTRDKVLILLTDGQGNLGVPIKQAIDYANKNLVKIYTIGIGNEEGAELIPGVILKLDLESLSLIAQNTEGKFYLAESEESLKKSYEEIARQTETNISRDLSFIFIIISLFLILIEWILFNTKYRTIP